MSRRVLYVAHPVAPSEEQQKQCRGAIDMTSSDPKWANKIYLGTLQMIVRENVARAGRWLQWLRRSFPEATFIAPWIADLLTGGDDADLAERERGIVDCEATVARCDGIVLCGGRLSSGMMRELAWFVGHDEIAARCTRSKGAVYDFIRFGLVEPPGSMPSATPGVLDAWIKSLEFWRVTESPT